MKKSVLSIVICAAMLAVAAPASAESAFAFIQGQRQGNFGGDELSKQGFNSINVLGVQHSIVSPRDAASGLPTGKRQHKPFVIKKLSDKASPKLIIALVTNESLTIEIKFYRPSTTGALVLYHTFKFTGANIASFETSGDTRTAGGVIETVSFTYQRIEITDHVNGQVAVDDWEAPIS